MSASLERQRGNPIASMAASRAAAAAQRQGAPAGVLRQNCPQPAVTLVLFILAALLYGAATFAYGAETPIAGRELRGYGRLFLGIGAVVHLAVIGSQCLQGAHPLKSVFLSSSLGAFIATLGYLLLSRRGRLDALGAIIAPMALLGLAVGVVFGEHGVQRLPGTEFVARAHVLLATAGVAGFTLAAGVAGLYLVMERKLRTKVFRPGQPGMSLTGLDRLHRTLVLLVTPVFTLAIVTGVLWIVRAGGPSVLADRMLELVASMVAWLASVVVLVSRAVWGTHGRRSAWLTLLAFGSVILVLAYYGVRA